MFRLWTRYGSVGRFVIINSGACNFDLDLDLVFCSPLPLRCFAAVLLGVESVSIPRLTLESFSSPLPCR